MWSYFRGWRRKAGLGALVIACVLMCGWGRSYLHLDVIQFSHHEQADQVWSFRGRLGLRRWVGTTFARTLHVYETADAKDAAGLVEQEGDPFVDVDATWRWGVAGFCLGEGTHVRGAHSPMAIATIPYWFPILVLSLLAAYLILENPRRVPRTVNFKINHAPSAPEPLERADAIHPLT